MAGFLYSIPVRWLTILISVMLLYDIFVPYPTSFSKFYDGQSAFVMVDVCHSSAPQSAEDDEMPTVAEKSDVVVPALSFDYTVPIKPVFLQFLLTSQHCRPPEA